MVHAESGTTRDCCTSLFHAHCTGGAESVVVLECSRCSRLWHSRNGTLVPYEGEFSPERFPEPPRHS